MPEDLVSEALRRVLAVRRPPAGLIVYSDQGS
jgi:putative transposase